MTRFITTSQEIGAASGVLFVCVRGVADQAAMDGAPSQVVRSSQTHRARKEPHPRQFPSNNLWLLV